MRLMKSQHIKQTLEVHQARQFKGDKDMTQGQIRRVSLLLGNKLGVACPEFVVCPFEAPSHPLTLLDYASHL